MNAKKAGKSIRRMDAMIAAIAIKPFNEVSHG